MLTAAEVLIGQHRLSAKTYYSSHAVKKVLSDSGTKTRRLGIEDDHVTLEVRRLIEDAFPGVELVDVSKATMAQRMFKSAEEIGKHIKNGARVRYRRCGSCF